MARDPLKWLGGVLVVYLGAPVALFALRFARAPQRGFHVAGLFPSLLISLTCATITLAVSCLFAIPLAYVLARSTSRWARALEVVVTVPLALPPVMGGIIVVYLVGPYSFLGSHFDRQLTNSPVGIIIAMTFCSAPFLVLTARAAFATMDGALLDVASTLGHSPMSRFLKVAVPVAGPEIRAGMTMTWLRAFGEYGAVTILAYNPASLPIYTVNQFMARGIAPTLAPTMLALIVAALVVLLSRVWIPHRRAELSQVTAIVPVLARSTRLNCSISKDLGSFHLDFTHRAQSDTIAILGPSGSGKSVLLRCLSGIYGVDVGEVSFGAQSVSILEPERRRVGYVAQGFSLFPHLTVWRNVMFATNARPEHAAFWVQRLKLEGLENLLPSQLSGGQRQRVALAQALCHEPDVLLLDEPFSALDVPVRHELQRELRRLQRDTSLATIVVTHDPEEAAFLAQEIIVIEAGQVLQTSASRTLFSRPVSREVARLLGISNVHTALACDQGIVSADGTVIAADSAAFSTGTQVCWSVRPECVGISRSAESGKVDHTSNRLEGTLVDVADRGTAVDIFIQLEEQLEIHARLNEPPDLVVGDRCWVTMNHRDVDVWQGSQSRESYAMEDPASHQ